MPVHLGPYPLGDDWAAWHSGNARAFSFLRSAPFLYSPAAKARVLALECAQRQRGALGDALLRGMMLAGGGGAAGCPYCVLRVRRDRLLADAAREIAAAARTRQLHKPLKVVFAGEEGVDEGGVQKEFFTLVARQIFSPDYGMWSPVDSAGRITWFAPGGAFPLWISRHACACADQRYIHSATRQCAPSCWTDAAAPRRSACRALLPRAGRSTCRALPLRRQAPRNDWTQTDECCREPHP